MTWHTYARHHERRRGAFRVHDLHLGERDTLTGCHEVDQTLERFAVRINDDLGDDLVILELDFAVNDLCSREGAKEHGPHRDDEVSSLLNDMSLRLEGAFEEVWELYRSKHGLQPIQSTQLAEVGGEAATLCLSLTSYR